MGRFNPLFYGWSLMLAVVLAGANLSPVYSDDPQLDLGNNAPAKNSGKATLTKVEVAPGQGTVQVNFTGKNLPTPKIEKVSAKTVKVVFPDTSWKAALPSRGGQKLIRAIRAADHKDGVWVVFDLSGVKNWDVAPSEDGFSLTFNSSQADKVSAKPDANDSSVDTPPATDGAPQGNNGNEKRLTARLVDTSFKPLENGLKIVLTADSPAKYTVRKISQPEKLVIRFKDTKLEVNSKLRSVKGSGEDLRKGGLVLMEMRQIGQSYSPFSEVLLTLVPGTTYQIDRDLNQVVVSLTAPVVKEAAVEKKGNINQLVSLEIEGADLTAVVKTLASEANFDVDIIGGTLTGTVNEKFKNIPLKTALTTLLTPGGYDYEVTGNTLRVGAQASLINEKAALPHVTELVSPSGGMTPPQLDTLVAAILRPGNGCKRTIDPSRNMIIVNGTASDVAEYKQAIRDLKLDEGAGGDRITRVVKLNYADTAQVITVLTPYLSPVGKAQSDLRTNSIVLWDSASNMGVLLELVKELDIKSPQVLIESNIVEVDDEKDLNLGVNWNAQKFGTDPSMGVSFNNPPGNPLANPAAFTFGTLRGGFDIGASLQALQTNKKGKIISRPRIATVSGVQAEINTTETVIVEADTQTVSNGVITVTKTFISLPLPIDLRVTPRITDDDRITTVVAASITSQTGQPVGAGAPPPTSVQTATTTITTKNGETIVIGGLVREISQETVNGIPLLSSLPILGNLFQQKDTQNRKVELIIFITPTLLED